MGLVRRRNILSPPGRILAGTVSVSESYISNTFATSIDLEVGDITPVLSLGEEHYVMVLTEKIIPTEEEVKGFIRDEYAYYEQQAIFDGEYEKWYADCTVEVNNELYEKITINK